MSDLGSVQGTHYNNFSQLIDNTSLSQPSLTNPGWFVNSEAINHITSNLNNLSLHAPYNVSDKIFDGNGKQLTISNVDLGQLYTQTKPTSIIALPHVLHVPYMKKNLISVSQLTNDHNVIAEFHSFMCLIKDKSSGLVLLRGRLKDGLYQLESAFGQANSTPDHSVTPKLPMLFAASSISLNKCNDFSLNNCKRQLPLNHGLSPSVSLAQSNNTCQQWHAH